MDHFASLFSLLIFDNIKVQKCLWLFKYLIKTHFYDFRFTFTLFKLHLEIFAGYVTYLFDRLAPFEPFSYISGNWRDVQRKNVVNNVDVSCLREPWQNGPYKNTHREQHKNTPVERQDPTDIQKITTFCVFRNFSIFIFHWWFLKWFLQAMLSYRLDTVNEFHWGFQPVLSYSKLHTFSTFFGEKKTIMCIYSL